ncbi:MAG: GntR family transcriptional regulator [Evtepia sp.]
MPWEFREDAPIYTQLIAQIQQRIVGGLSLGPGARLPLGAGPGRRGRGEPQHDAAGLTELEREGIVHSQRAPPASFVTEDAERIRQLREELARQRAGRFLEDVPAGLPAGVRSLPSLHRKSGRERGSGRRKTP